MTENEWFNKADVSWAISFVVQHKGISDRKVILAACACCRRIWTHLANPRSRTAIEALERFADSNSPEDHHLASEMAESAANAIQSEPSEQKWYYVQSRAATAVVWACMRSVRQEVNEVFSQSMDALGLASGTRATHAAEDHAQLVILRDIFGNPFRPVAFDVAWNTSTVVAVAQGMYASRDFSAMPILADALQDAGCDNDDILQHCRGAGPHVRGCWVVDGILGKS